MIRETQYVAVSKFGSPRWKFVAPTRELVISDLVSTSWPQPGLETEAAAWERFKKTGWRIAKIEIREVKE